MAGGFDPSRDRQSLPSISLTVTTTSGMTAAFGFTDTMRPPPTRIVSKSSATSCLRRSGQAADRRETGFRAAEQGKLGA